MKMNIENKNTDAKDAFPWGILKVALMLLVILFLLVLYSFTEREIRFLNMDIKQNNLFSFFEPVHDVIGYKGVRFQWVRCSDVDTTKQRFLLAGDSMSGFFRLRLNDYCEKNGHSMYSLVWNSGNTVWFAETDTLDHFIRKVQPTYILIVLGGNELRLPKPEYRQKHIDKIIEKIGEIPFIWIGPPNWQDDTGINDLILRSVGRKRFFPSLNLSYNRMPDGAHPTRESAYDWMDSVAIFLSSKARHPIVMTYPEKHATSYPPTTMLAPVRANRESIELSTDPDQQIKPN